METHKPQPLKALETLQRAQLCWPGKPAAAKEADAPTTKTLRPCVAESVDFDNTQNLFIEGDNLDALKLLQNDYSGKVKMIYIDPPYNTGKDFLYRDSYGNWLSMMYSRLRLARDLLAADGAIFISIDDNEASNLAKICDEIFGDENRLVTHYIQVRYAGKTLAEKHHYQKLIEQVLVYQKGEHAPIKHTEEYSLSPFCWRVTELEAGRKETIGGKDVEIFLPGQYKIEEIEAGLDGLKETWATGSVLKTNASGKYFGTYLAPRKAIDGLAVLYKVTGIGEDGLGYRYFTGPKRETATKGTFFAGVPSVRREEIESGTGCSKEKAIVNFYDMADAFGNCRHEGGVGFRGGKKPVKFLETLIRQGCRDGVVLDFFAGSGSTAHAVMKLNAQDGGNRRFILVQLAETVNKDDVDVGSNFKTISELSMERIRRSGEQVKRDFPSAKDLDVGFRVFKLVERL